MMPSVGSDGEHRRLTRRRKLGIQHCSAHLEPDHEVSSFGSKVAMKDSILDVPIGSFAASQMKQQCAQRLRCGDYCSAPS